MDYGGRFYIQANWADCEPGNTRTRKGRGTLKYNKEKAEEPEDFLQLEPLICANLEATAHLRLSALIWKPKFSRFLISVY